KVHAYAMTALTETNDPFLKVVDRENMERILAEQRLSLSGVVDEQTAVRVGNLIGAQAVLMGEVVDYREVPGELRRSTKDGYETYTETVIDPKTGAKTYVPRTKAVRYAEYLQENKVYMTFNYRLVSLETGEVLVSKVVDRQEQDHMYYADYQGNRDALVPMKNGLPDLSARHELRNLLNAPRQVKSVETLSMQAVSSATSNMAQAVQQELNSKLP
ncbi:MAG TPA: CsgG/HfaB family protein, partial [Flavobacteriales bacterium]|nr:CsgG/HfaB family protein [Flavobacteriales bacterium]